MHEIKTRFQTLLRKWGASVVACLVGVVIVFAALILFQAATLRTVESSVHKYMVEMSATAVLTLQNSLQSCADLLELQAKQLGVDNASEKNNILTLLEDFAQDARFERLTYVNANAVSYSSAFGVNALGSLNQVPSFHAEGTCIGQPRIAQDGTQVFDISTPVYRDGQKIGVLLATIGDKILHSMYSTHGLEGDATLCMFAADGTVIGVFSGRDVSIAPKDNIFAPFAEDEAPLLLQGSLQAFKRGVLARDTGWLKYRLATSTVCLYYAPMAVNDWYMAITATDLALQHQSNDIRNLSLMLTLCIVAVTLTVSVVIIMQRVREQRNIDALKNTYNMAIRKTNDLFYEADIDSDVFVDHSEHSEKAIWKEAPKNYSKALLQVANVCSPEYRQEFLDTFLPQNIKIKVKEGISFIHFEYKITPDENTVRWLSATLVPVADGEHGATKLICMENDITDQKLRQERLRRSATVDGLTGLFNRDTTQGYINTFLAGEGAEGAHALMLIDIDYFKSVNDTLGHAKGDTVLTQYAALLRKVFRRNDIVGRIGGDEFVVLLKDYDVPELIAGKAMEICDGFRQRQCLEDDPEKTVNISASIGVALFARDGENFDTLYKHADVALYAAKKAGRDRFTLYTATR